MVASQGLENNTWSDLLAAEALAGLGDAAVLPTTRRAICTICWTDPGAPGGHNVELRCWCIAVPLASATSLRVAFAASLGVALASTLAIGTIAPVEVGVRSGEISRWPLRHQEQSTKDRYKQ